MEIKFAEYEDILFEYVKKIKNFNELLIKNYQLTDIPYNVSNEKLPKKGTITNEKGRTISYNFHGKGATFFEEEIEVDFLVQASSKCQIIIPFNGFESFLSTYLEKHEENTRLLEDIMVEFEHRGIFLTRTIWDLWSFHVNETWYEAKLKGLPFNGENKDDIDWLDPTDLRGLDPSIWPPRWRPND